MKKDKQSNSKKSDTGTTIEAILFAAGEPVSRERLTKFLKLNRKDLDQEIEQLSDFYKNHSRGLALVQKKTQVQLVSAHSQAKAVSKFLNKELHEPLSPSALEVLAIVAYRGPITRAGIEEIRGVNSSFALRLLSIKGLLERRDNPLDSRSYIYEASLDLIKALGLEKIEDLPEFEKLKEKLSQGDKNESEQIDENESEVKN